jgi:hypothetical protein
VSDWKVEVSVRGRGGTIVYTERDNVAHFEWELGGGDVVAIISGPTPQDWNAELPWARGRRAEILMRVADDVIRIHAPTSSAELSDDDTTVVLRRTRPPA